MFYFGRMSGNNSQIGQCPSDSLMPNLTPRFNIDQLLSMEIVTTTTTTTNQSLTSSSTPIPLNQADMSVDIQQQPNNEDQTQNPPPEEQPDRQQQAFQQIAEQQNRQEQQQRLQQRRQYLELELRRVQQQQQSLRQQTQRARRHRQRTRRQQRFDEWLESQNLTHEQWEDRRNQERARWLEEGRNREAERRDREAERYRQEREEREHSYYLQLRSPGFDENLDEIFQERQLEQYQLERKSTQERRAVWQQEHLSELQGYSKSSPYEMIWDDLRRYALYLEEQLWNDEDEQTINIEEMHQSDRLEQNNRNEEQLIQKEQWEEIQFLHQQLQQPSEYSN